MSDETIQRVSKCVAEVLALDLHNVRPQSKLIEDLKADSLDLVELMYLLEQEFEITLSRNDMSVSAQLGLPEEELHQNEVLTPKALEMLRERFPWAQHLLNDGIQRKHLAALITVEEIANAIERKLAAVIQ